MVSPRRLLVHSCFPDIFWRKAFLQIDSVGQVKSLTFAIRQSGDAEELSRGMWIKKLVPSPSLLWHSIEP